MGTVFLLAACADVRNIPITEVEARPRPGVAGSRDGPRLGMSK